MLLNPAALFMGMAASVLLLDQSRRRLMETTVAEPTARERYSARVRLLKRINAGYRPSKEEPKDVYQGSFRARARKLTWREWINIAWAGMFR